MNNGKGPLPAGLVSALSGPLLYQETWLRLDVHLGGCKHEDGNLPGMIASLAPLCQQLILGGWGALGVCKRCARRRQWVPLPIPDPDMTGLGKFGGLERPPATEAAARGLERPPGTKAPARGDQVGGLHAVG
jgi:hypothetical protein